MIMLAKTGARSDLILTTSFWSYMIYQTKSSTLTCIFYKFGHSMFPNVSID